MTRRRGSMINYCGVCGKNHDGTACPMDKSPYDEAMDVIDRLKVELAERDKIEDSLQTEIKRLDKQITDLTAKIGLLNKELSDTRWRLQSPYAAFLLDSFKKDNCRNCIHKRPPTISHNEDRISCKYADGWPHWTNKCNKWEGMTAEALKEKP